MTLAEVLQRQQVSNEIADALLAQLPVWSEGGSDWDPLWERDLLLFEVRYAPYREREARLLEGQRAWDQVRIPASFAIEDLPGLSREVKEKFAKHRPETLGQASRIPGITPAAVTLIHLMMGRGKSV
jgi:tRNA uridine 5-carboxymethylaminomethyl modification enzyme